MRDTPIAQAIQRFRSVATVPGTPQRDDRAREGPGAGAARRRMGDTVSASEVNPVTHRRMRATCTTVVCFVFRGVGRE